MTQHNNATGWQSDPSEDAMSIDGEDEVEQTPASMPTWREFQNKKWTEEFGIKIHRSNSKNLMGEGHFARVHAYLIPDKNDADKTVIVAAIKTSKAQVKESSYQNWFKEFAVMQHFDSIFLVQAYDYCVASRYVKIAMEPCSYDLFSFIEEKPRSLADITVIFGDIVSGLSTLHDQSFIHRDLHPGNILFSGHNWKLSDFGSSRFLDDDSGVMTSNIGCRFYRSPESNCNDYGKEVDVFSLGVVCFDIFLAFSDHSYYCSEYKNFRTKNLFTLSHPKHTLRCSFTTLCAKLTHDDRAKRLQLKECTNAFKNAIQSEDDDDNDEDDDDDDDDIVIEKSFQSMGIHIKKLYQKELMTKDGLKQAINDSQNKLVISNDLVVCLSKRFVAGLNPGNVKKKFRNPLLKLLGISKEDAKEKDLKYAHAIIQGAPLS